MKYIFKTIVLTLFCTVLFTSCDLEENPPFLANENVYTSVEGADVALNGILSSMAGGSYYGADFHHASNYMSGVFTAKKASDRVDIAALSPRTDQNYITNLWRQMYQTVGRTNDMIANIDPNSGNDEMNNILGISYFLRAQTYFNLVRLYGGVPLHTEPASAETLSLPRASVDDVYALIISDLEKAESLMAESNSASGRPGKYAANMVLAQVYMTLAGNDNSSSNWQKAYDEAIKVYGKFSLVPNYGDLWASEDTANNNDESIFEIQYNVENPSALTKLFTPNNAYPGRGWERFRANPEIIDDHNEDDPRYGFTYISQYKKNGTGATVKVYPSSNRNNTRKAYPYIYKYFVKDQTATTDFNNYNFVVLRYADLLLMLAEIENELGMSAAAHGHVNEVLARARASADPVAAEPADWAGLSQDDFRSAIMKEYQYELLGEGQDFFVAHRRGYDFFKTNYIIPHNTYSGLKGHDIIYPELERVMLLPIPNTEIETNDAISASDQNPGY